MLNIFNVYQVAGTFLNLSECFLLTETIDKQPNDAMEWRKLTPLRTGTLVTWYIEYSLFQIFSFTFMLEFCNYW